MAAKKRNHMDAIKRNQALHTFMFQTNSTSFMLKDGPSSTKTAKTGCAHSHSKHIWCNICRKAIAYHNMQNAEKHLKTHAALYHQFTSSYNHQFLQSPPVKRVKRSIAQNDEDLVKFGYSVLEGNQVDTRMRTRYRIPPSDPWRFDTSDSNTNRNTLSDNEYDENVSPSIEEVRDEHSIKTPKHKSLSSRTRRQLLKLIVKFDPHHVELTDDILNDISRNPAFEMYTKYELYRNVFSFFKTVARTLFDGMVVQHNEEIEKKKKRKMKRRKHCKTDAKKKRNAKKKKKRTIEYNFDSEESNGICDSEESNGICDSEGEPNRKLRRSKRLQKNKQIAIQNEVQRESQIKFCIDECIQNEKSEDGDVTWIECEGKDCARKWFHIECLGIAENELSDIKNYFCNDCM
eukprot:390794_1